MSYNSRVISIMLQRTNSFLPSDLDRSLHSLLIIPSCGFGPIFNSFRSPFVHSLSMTSAIIVGFDIIVIFSFVFGLLVLSTAAFSPEVHRQPTWYGFLVPLFIYDIILLFGLGYQTDAGPPAGFCVFQAVLLYSIPGW